MDTERGMSTASGSSSCLAGLATMVCSLRSSGCKPTQDDIAASFGSDTTCPDADTTKKERFYSADSTPSSQEDLSDAGSSELSEHESEFPAIPLLEEVEITEIRVIFLDIDGPIAPWKRGKPHRWNASETLDKGVYARNTLALRRIIDGAGGPKTVKVVISSNWRTDDEKYPWLVEQLEIAGIDVIGHTDFIHVHPAVKGDGGALQRNLEIQRGLHFNMFGQGGPMRDASGVNTFRPFDIPPTWKITSWIAIDDLGLDKVVAADLNKVGLFAGSMRRPEDQEVGNGWLAFPTGFRLEMQAFLESFSASHFVHVRSEEGIAGTPNAEQLAIQLLEGI